MLVDGGPEGNLIAVHNDDKDFIRLHITPLDSDLLKVYVPPSLLPAARNISYHTIETFPERRYGFVELPKADADRLRAKLNGAVLKGTKVAIEKARSKSEMGSQEKEEKRLKKLKKKEQKEKAKEDKSDESRKRKRDDNVVDGVALTDRKVKRGWTETPDESVKRKRKERSEKRSTGKDKGKDKDTKEQEKEDKKDKKDKKEKKRTKSKFTDQEECLLKTKLPPTAVSNADNDDNSNRKKRKKGNTREVTIHEFENTTKFPSFLKDSSAGSSHPSATEYIEGKGWVDEEGTVVEAVTIKKPAKASSKSKKVPKVVVEDEGEDDETSSSGSSSDEEPAAGTKTLKSIAAQDDDDATSSEGISDSDSDSGDDDDEAGTQPHKSVEQATPVSELKSRVSQPASSPTTRNLSIKIPPVSTPTDKLHPLEALYKRNPPGEAAAGTSAQQDQPFSFFGGGGDEEDEDDEGRDQPAPMPMTPFTRQDLEWRNTRSAAPTPDTAHPSRMLPFVWPTDDDVDEDMEDITRKEDEEEEEEGEEEGTSAADPEKGTGDFQSWFWENRGDLNRSWMKRRKTAAKEKRHRENKSRASRAV